MDVCAMYLNMHARTPVQGSMLPFFLNSEHPNAASELDVPHDENNRESFRWTVTNSRMNTHFYSTLVQTNYTCTVRLSTKEPSRRFD
jgi:hypothetical protein